MEELIKDNYDSIVKRGLINKSTTIRQFLDKIYEEYEELELAYEHEDMYNFNEELADVILTCLNTAYHLKIDIETELKKKIEINKNR